MDKYIPFINRQLCCKIPLGEIMYIEQQGRKIMIVTDKTVYRKYGKISDYKECFDSRFFYCLQSVVINFANVLSMREQAIKFVNGEEIYIGRQNFVRTKQTFAVYLKEYGGI